MSNVLKLRLKPRERLFVNGAVLQVDRRVGLSFLNDVSFLLEAYVIQASEVTTPLRELYFVIQSMLIEPATKDEQRRHIGCALIGFLNDPKYRDVYVEIEKAVHLAQADQCFEALKILRATFPVEEAGAERAAVDQTELVQAVE